MPKFIFRSNDPWNFSGAFEKIREEYHYYVLFIIYLCGLIFGYRLTGKSVFLKTIFDIVIGNMRSEGNSVLFFLFLFMIFLITSIFLYIFGSSASGIFSVYLCPFFSGFLQIPFFISAHESLRENNFLFLLAVIGLLTSIVFMQCRFALIMSQKIKETVNGNDSVDGEWKKYRLRSFVIVLIMAPVTALAAFLLKN